MICPECYKQLAKNELLIQGINENELEFITHLRPASDGINMFVFVINGVTYDAYCYKANPKGRWG